MGIIEEKRRMIMSEMEAGRGGDRCFLHPVSLEPPFTPYLTRQLGNLRDPFFKRLFGEKHEETPAAKDSPGLGELRFIRIKPSREDENSLDAVEQFILSLPAGSPLSFEIIGHGGIIYFQVALNSFLADPVIVQLRSYFSNAEAAVEKDLIKSAWSPQAVARAYRLKSTHFLPLGLASDKGLDPMRSLLGSLSSLGAQELGVLQILFVPVKEDWPDNMKRASRSHYDPSLSPFVDLPQLPKSADKKIAKPLYAASLRLLASSEAVLTGLERFFKQFESQENGIIPVSGSYPAESCLRRNTYVYGSLLNLTELSYFIHLPAPDLILSTPAIEDAEKTYAVQKEYTFDGPVLGMNSHRGIDQVVRHSSRLPNRHVFSTGKSGYGKSNLILSAAIQRIEQGDGIGIIDPHGSLIKDGILPRIPKERLDDVIYFNAGDFQFPLAINPLAHSGTKMEKEHIRVDLLDFFESLFDAPLGVNVQHSLNFFIITLLQFKDSTLLDLERLLLDKEWRGKIVESTQDERVRMFWQEEFPQLEKRGIITAITNKLTPITLPDSTIAPMLTNRENKIDFLKIMNEKKIFLANIGHGAVGKRNSQLLGKLLVSKIQIAAMMREGDFPDWFLFIDEFQHVATPSMADILSGARKYRLHLWLATQLASDITPAILRQVFNAATMIFFATDSPADQAAIEKILSGKFKAEEIGRLKKGATFVKMVASSFNMKTAKVPDIDAKGYTNEIIDASRAKYTTRATAARSHPIGLEVARAPARDSLPTQTPGGKPLSDVEKGFLLCAFHNPLLNVTQLFKAGGFSAYMGDKLKSALKTRGLLEELDTHLGAGSRRAKFTVLTPQGFAALGIIFSPEDGKGGPLHRYWQTVIRTQAESRGYTVSIEQAIPDSRETVDLVLARDGKEIAVEVSSTTQAIQEIGNVKKCLAAGYKKVVTLFMDEEKLQVFEGLLENELDEQERSKVSTGMIHGFCRFLK